MNMNRACKPYGVSCMLVHLVSHHRSDCVSSMYINSDQCSYDVPDELGQFTTHQLSQLIQILQELYRRMYVASTRNNL